MPIPAKTNEMLVPFLDILSDGAVHEKSAIVARLAQHFHVTSAELAQATPTGKPKFSNRVDWCHAHFTGAEFTENVADGKLKITPRGLDQFTNHRDRITVAYLKSFSRR